MSDLPDSGDNVEILRARMAALRSRLDWRRDQLIETTHQMFDWRSYLRKYPGTLSLLSLGVGFWMAPSARQAGIQKRSESPAARGTTQTASGSRESSINSVFQRLNRMAGPVLTQFVARYVRDKAVSHLHQILNGGDQQFSVERGRRE